MNDAPNTIETDKQVAPQTASNRKKSSRLLLKATTKTIPDDMHYCARAIVEVLREAGPQDPSGSYTAVSRDVLLEGLNAKSLKSKQDSTRILYYWKKFLLTQGFIEKVIAAPPVVSTALADTVPTPA